MYPTPVISNKILLDIAKKIENTSDINLRNKLICEYNTKKFVLGVMLNNEDTVRKLS